MGNGLLKVLDKNCRVKGERCWGEGGKLFCRQAKVKVKRLRPLLLTKDKKIKSSPEGIFQKLLD